MGSYSLSACGCCTPGVCDGNFWLFDALGYTFSQVQVTIQFQDGDFSGLGERTSGFNKVPSYVPSPTVMNGTYVFDLGIHYQTREPVRDYQVLDFFEGSNPEPQEPGDLINHTNYSAVGDGTGPSGSDPPYSGPGWSVTRICSTSGGPYFAVTGGAFTHSAAKYYSIFDSAGFPPAPSGRAVFYGGVYTFGNVERDFTSLYVNRTVIRELDDGKLLVLTDSKTTPASGYNAWGNNPFTVDVDLNFL